MSFARWVWQRSGTPEKVAAAFILWIAIMLVNVCIFGKLGLLIFMMGLLGAMLTGGLYTLSKGLREQYRKYRNEYNAEQDEIVNRLKGNQ
jgi:hypothetical protein